MRCMQHFNDSTSYTGGVCSSCLRERLFIVIVAQNEFNLSRQQDPRRRLHDLEDDTDFDNDVVDFIPDVYPISSNTPPLDYEDSRRQSDVIGSIDGPGMENPRFYATPQVGPNGKLIIAAENRCYGRWSLFRSKSEKPNPVVVVVSDPCPDPDVVDTGIYNSWFEKFFTGRRRTVSVVEKPATIPRRNQVNSRLSDKGVSPVRFTDEEDETWHRRSSGSSSESSMPWNKTPKMTPAWVAPGRKGVVVGGGSSDSMCSNGKTGHKRQVTGFGFCWSPLVRARPNRHRKGITPDMIVSGDLPAFKPPLCNAVSLYKNRSRKLTDFGRFRHHR